MCCVFCAKGKAPGIPMSVLLADKLKYTVNLTQSGRCPPYLIPPSLLSACSVIWAHGCSWGLWLVSDPCLCGLPAQQVEPSAVWNSLQECDLPGWICSSYNRSCADVDRYIEICVKSCILDDYKSHLISSLLSLPLFWRATIWSNIIQLWMSKRKIAFFIFYKPAWRMCLLWEQHLNNHLFHWQLNIFDEQSK